MDRGLTRLALGITLILLSVRAPTRTSAQASHPTWRLCREHLDWPTASHVVRTVCARYPLKHETRRPLGHRLIEDRRVSPHVVERVWFPVFARPSPSSRQETWEVTYYVDSGVMADGRYTHWGAAACGYDVAFFTRVYVPGVGTFVCEDHIGANPWHHIDVWGYRSGLGNDYRTVSVYP